MTSRSELMRSRLEEITPKLRGAQLLAVTKSRSLEDIDLCYQLGLRNFGENRVSELETKAKILSERALTDVRWHFIGHLQRNKVKSLLQVPGLVAIHSIDRSELLDELLKHEELFKGPVLDLYIEMNLGGEVEKHGFTDLSQVALLIDRKREFLPASFRFKGLMVMAPIRTDQREESARKCFETIKEYARILEERFGHKLELSMGMSDDFEIACECGSDMVRIGSLLFN